MEIETAVELPGVRFYWYKADSYYWEYKAKEFLSIKDLEYDSMLPIKFPEFDKPPFLLPSPESEGLTTWKPLEDEPGLFFEFATVDPTEEGILEFANKYGPLANSCSVALTRKPKTDQKGDPSEPRVYKGDPLELWIEELKHMATLVGLWIALEKNDTAALAKVVEWSEDSDGFKKAEVKTDTASYLLVHEALMPLTTFRRFTPGDLRLPARSFILKFTNLQLEKYPVHLRLGVEDSNNELASYLEPESLLSAMLLQFHNVVIGRNKFKQCPICLKWQDVTEKSPRWSRHPKCANRERARKHYEKTKKAKKPANKTPAKKPTKKTPAAKKTATSKGRSKK